MPKYWYNRSSNSVEEVPNEKERRFNLRILADKKPYFMRYIYPNLMSQYRNYIKRIGVLLQKENGSSCSGTMRRCRLGSMTA